MKRLLLPVVALVALIAASCSSEGDESRLLNAVPADASSVSFVNLDRLAKDGIDIDALAKGRLPLHSGLRAFVTLADGTSLQISDLPEPDSLAAAGYVLSGEAGEPFTTYTRPDGASVVADTKRSVAYFTVFSSSRALETVTAVASAAEKQPFSANKGLADFFGRKSDDAAIFGAISMKLLGASEANTDNPQSARWIAYDVKEESGVADLAAKMIEGSGKPVKITGVQEIDTDFLRYVPADMNVVAAAGLTPEVDWNAAGRLLGVVSNRETAAIFAMAAPYLKAIDGTVAVATRADGSSAIPPVFVMAHMDRDKINDLMTQLSALASMWGAKSTTTGSIMRLSAPGLPTEFYIGEVDGNFAAANFPLDGKADNSFAQVFEGHDAAAVVTATPGALPAAQFPEASGIDVRFSLDDSEAHLRLSFPGSKESPLAVIAKGVLR